MRFLNKLFPKANVRTAGNRMKMIGIFCVALVAMLVNPIVRIFNSYVNIAIIICIAAVCFCSHRFLAVTEDNSLVISAKGLFVIDRKAPKKYLWLLVLVATAMGYIKGSWRMGNLIDLVVIGIGILMIIDAPDSLSGYKIVMRVFVAFSLVYAIGIWVEVFLPNLHDKYIDLLSHSGVPYKAFENYYTGFATNPQFAAGYISLGVFALVAELPHKRPVSIVMLAFLLYTLLYTGVRMQVAVIYVLVVLMLYVFVPKKKWVMLSALLCVVIAAVWLAAVFFPEQMGTIPVFRRLYFTAEKLQNGENISSGRSALHQLAWTLFKQNPVFGIGWGNFREMVPGTVTQVTRFDVHCIYLQVLCEIGVVGFLCYCPALLYTGFKTLKEYIVQIKIGKKTMESRVLGFSLLYQIYFFGTGILDNTLYSLSILIPYLISCGMLYAYLHSISGTQKTKVQINERQ